MPATLIETPRLLIRPFIPDDLRELHRIFSFCFGDGSQADDPAALAKRESYLRWSALSQEWAPRLDQPPYGVRAVTLKDGGALIGASGLVPCLDSFEQLPGFGAPHEAPALRSAEVGLFWAIDPGHQRQGYASEAGGALIAHAFADLRLKRIIATTEHNNEASQAVMRKLGMRLLRNPSPDPFSLQVVGVLDHP